MRGLTIGFVLALTMTAAGTVAAGELTGASDEAGASPFAAFNPGPPLWLPPVMRPKATTTTNDMEQIVDQCVGDAMTLADTPGASVAVIIDGVVVYEQGYGVKRRDGSDPVNSETQFRVGSVTKMLTAAAVMQQVEAGTVFLDDRLTRHVPEVEFLGQWPAEVMTVEHLMTHATGIPDLIFRPWGATGPDALGEWALTLNEIGLHGPPGAFWNYSNPNFNLAGLVVERASGMDYRSYMETHVFTPAGMSRTTFDPATVAAGGNYSYGHQPDDPGDETIYAPDDYDNGAYAPAGYAFSTAGDLARWALLLSDGGGDVLSAQSASAMQAPNQDMDTIPGNDYGYGVFVEPFYDLTVRQHGGNIWGWGTYLLWHPERRFAVAVLANTFQSLPGAAYCIADAVLEPDHSVAPQYPIDPERLEMFEGIYDVSLRASISPNPYPASGEVWMESGGRLLLHLWIQNSGWDEVWILDHAALDVFYVDIEGDGVYDLDLSFLTSDGTPDRVRWMRMRPAVGNLQVAPRGGRRIEP
jgi:CubicO group peptidase (beta-lactamase class C family)